MLTFFFEGAAGRMTIPEELTVGMAGKKVKLEFSKDWEGLSKTAVFMAGDAVRDVAVLSDEVRIPLDVMRKPLEQLWVGVYGFSPDGTVVIPTVRAMGPVISPAVDPSGDSRSSDPELPIWGQLQTAVEEMRQELEDVGSGGYYAPAVTQPTEQTMQISFTPTGDDMPAVAPVTIILPGGSAEDPADGKDGGYYTVTVDQPTPATARFRFQPSQADMAQVAAQTVTLPSGPQGIQGEQGIQGQQGAAGEPGLSVFCSDENVPDSAEQMEYDIGSMDTGGRQIQTGDLIINVHGELFRVTEVSSSIAVAAYLGSLMGPKGEDGESGATPVRGQDYWTDADIAQIKSYVDEAILGGAW